MPAQRPLLTQAQLGRYLQRVGYSGELSPTRETLVALHRAHLYAITYENLDIHLGRRLTLDPERIFEKIVDEHRGGWCYEMNGLFGRVLDAVGFAVTRVSGTVGRATRGDDVEGNHLILLVELDGTWIADVGFGDGFLEPIPLIPGKYRQGYLEYSVERTADERWFVRNQEFGSVDGFDFVTTPREMSYFARQCENLQTSPDSGLAQKTVCERFVPGGLITLRGAVFTRLTERGVEPRIVSTSDEFHATLRDEFDLTIPGAADLFPEVWRRHLEWRRSQEVQST